MAWTAVVTHATGDVFPASDWNTYVRDNLTYLHGGAGTIDISAGGAVLRFASAQVVSAIITAGSGYGPGGAGGAGTYSDSGGRFLSTAAAPLTDAFATSQVGDTQYRFIVNSNGVISWGPGGATAPDTNLYRSGVGTLQTDGVFIAGGTTTKHIEIGIDRIGGGQAQVGFGNAAAGAPDLVIYRPAAGVLAVGSTSLSGAGNVWQGLKIGTQAATSTYTPDGSYLVHKINVTSGGAGTLTIAAPTTPPAGSQSAFMIVRIANSGGGTITLAWNAAYIATGITALPAPIANGATSTCLFFWDGNAAKWDLLSVN